MFNYLAFLYGGCPEASDDAFADGQDLARQCLDQLSSVDNPEQFPPCLLILLASPAYLEVERAEQLLVGIHQAFADADHHNVHLIGSSVAAVFFDRQSYKRGALLVCLSSRMLGVKVAVGQNARNDLEGATDCLTESLGLKIAEKGNDPNPRGDRLLLTFFPGYGEPSESNHYPAPDLHRLLRNKMRARVPIVGGTSSAGEKKRPGRQFIDRCVYTDALVAARIFSGFPFTSSISHGLSSTKRLLRVAALGSDQRTILAFEEGLPAEVLGLKREKEIALLAGISPDMDRIVYAANKVEGQQAIETFREMHGDVAFEVLEPEPERMRQEALSTIRWSLQRLRIENPIGCFGIHCAARLSMQPDIALLASDVERSLGKRLAYIGGFFDGEAGLEKGGHSWFGNWCVATICFGDEMRERTPFYSGFEAMATYETHQTKFSSIDQAIEQSLDLIFRTGFPGAMISLVLDNEERKFIVARKAKGSRFEKIVGMTRRQFAEVELTGEANTKEDILAIVAREQRPKFVPDSRRDSSCDWEAINVSGIVSQYVIPLCDLNGETIAVLQIDLGDASYKKRLHKAEKSVLDSLGAVIAVTLTRSLNNEEARIARELDEALKTSLLEPTMKDGLQCYIEKAVRSFGVEMGHIRIAQCRVQNQVQQQTLVMAAGLGQYYEAFRHIRRKIDYRDASPAWHAFHDDKVLVVNDALSNEWNRTLCERYRTDLSAVTALGSICSYANVGCLNERREPLGTINLSALQAWVFTRSLTRSVKALGQRVGYLLEHFAHKEAETRHRRLIQFLSDVGPTFVRTADFRHPIQVLSEATERFCHAANAEVASLFIWDEEAQQFILRAEYGWSEKGWVDAARCQRDERWTGRVAMKDLPEYVPDLNTYYRAEKIEIKRRYADKMFGTNLSDDFTVEAIGLPMKAKDKNLGVLTLCRRVSPDREDEQSGFTTIDPEVLKEAANNMTALVSAQLYYLQVIWENEERERHNKVCDALEQHNTKASLEEQLCWQVARIFRAIRAEFYLTNSNQASPTLTWVSGIQRWPEEAKLTPANPDPMIERAARLRQTQEKRHQIVGEDWSNPETAKTEGLVERVCLPILDGNYLIGILDLHWTLKRRSSLLLTIHNRVQLENLGRRIGTIYQQQKRLAQQKKAEEQAGRSRLAAQTMGVMLFQSAHRLMNLVQDLSGMPDLIADEKSVQGRQQRIDELAQLINSAVDRIKRPMDIARRTKQITPQSYSLRVLLEQVLYDLGRIPTIEVQWRLPDNLIVWADDNLVKEAFRNIIHNALKAMAGGGVLNLRAAPIQRGKTIRILISDSGGGMSKEEIEAAMTGFFSTRDSTGLGVLTSLVLIRANNGNLKIKSRKGVGTHVSVTLPAEPTEEVL